MRVLHVAPYYPPERAGGVGVYVSRLHRALHDAGLRSRVWTRGPPRADDPEEVERIATTAVGWAASLPGRARAAAGFDVVHVHAGEALPLLAALSLRPRRPRIVATWHVGYAEVARARAPYAIEGRRFASGARERSASVLGTRAHRVADRLALSLVDAAVPISRAGAADLLRRSRAATPVIHHGVPPPQGEPARRLPRAALLYVGDAGHRKRCRALPALLGRVRAARPAARLRIVGIPPDASPDLARDFAARGLAGAVDWAGVLPPEALAACHRVADLLVAPAAYEGLPLAVVEALRAGLPVVATRIPGHAEAVDEGISGHLVPLDDPAAMAARCIDLLRDDAGRARMGGAAARIARERFAMERHVAAYVSLYERLCGDAP